jgi:hypothetical protein
MGTGLALELHQARYENQLQMKANQNLTDFSYFQDSNRVAITREMQAKIDAMQKTNTLLTNK